MDKVLIDDRRIHVDFSQSVSKLHKDSIRGSSKPLEYYGEGLEMKRRYRGQKETYEGKYSLLFDSDRKKLTARERREGSPRGQNYRKYERRDERSDYRERYERSKK